MNPAVWIRRWLVMALVCGGAAGMAAPTNAPVRQPPLPLVPSPVRVLRELLAEPAAEREQSLAMYPVGLREPLKAKVTEYLAMAPDLRELRFQATDLRHYLLQLLPLDRPAQTAALDGVPESIREVVAERLEWWHLLPPSLQREFLENEEAVRYFTQMGITSEEQRRALLEITPPGAREQMEERIADWLAQPEETRRRVFAQFNNLFTLTPGERQKTLRRLSEPERETLNRTLATFIDLAPPQRKVCLRSFERFSRMSLEARRDFLLKAKAWERMSPAERQQWREVVSMVRELPPLPPGATPGAIVPAPGTATNGG